MSWKLHPNTTPAFFSAARFASFHQLFSVLAMTLPPLLVVTTNSPPVTDENLFNQIEWPASPEGS